MEDLMKVLAIVLMLVPVFASTALTVIFLLHYLNRKNALTYPQRGARYDD